VAQLTHHVRGLNVVIHHVSNNNAPVITYST
jgi:hypothetical protein